MWDPHCLNIEKGMENEVACKIHAASSSPSLPSLWEESFQGKKKKKLRHRVGCTPSRTFEGGKISRDEAACGIHTASSYIGFWGGKKANQTRQHVGCTLPH